MKHSETYYQLHDERGEWLDIKAAGLGVPQHIVRVDSAIADLTDQIRLLEALEDCDPRTAAQQGADEDAADEQYTRTINQS